MSTSCQNGRPRLIRMQTIDLQTCPGQVALMVVKVESGSTDCHRDCRTMASWQQSYCLKGSTRAMNSRYAVS